MDEALSDNDLRIAELADRFDNRAGLEGFLRGTMSLVMIGALYVLPGALLMSVVPDVYEMDALKWMGGLAGGALVFFCGSRLFDTKRFVATAEAAGFEPDRARKIFKLRADEGFEVLVAANKIARKIAHAEHQ